MAQKTTVTTCRPELLPAGRHGDSGSIRVSIGVFGYLEPNSITGVLWAMANQKTNENIDIGEIIAVVDADTESKRKIEPLCGQNKKIRLSYSSQRVGKSAAINRFFKEATGDILVMCDADNLIEDENLISKLIEPLLKKPNIGIVGGHPIPLKTKKNNLATFAGENLWAIHHQIALMDPKISGNLYAIRSENKTEIPYGVICDDTFLQFFIEKSGLKKAYQPKAQVVIKIPDNLHDYIRQRIKIYLGYRQLKKILKQSPPSTTKIFWTMKMIFSRAKTPKDYLLSILTILLEGSIRLYCSFYPIGRKQQINLWPMAKSTKF